MAGAHTRSGLHQVVAFYRHHLEDTLLQPGVCGSAHTSASVVMISTVVLAAYNLRKLDGLAVSCTACARRH